jgi:hypothetical protein
MSELTPREHALLANTDVAGYIHAKAEARNAQARAEGWTFWSNPCASLAGEFANVYEYEHSFACNDYSDYYKELNGIRPRWVMTSQMTLAQVEALLDGLSAEAEAKAEQEKEWQAEDHARQVEFDRQQALVQEEYSWEMTDGIMFALQDRLMGL